MRTKWAVLIVVILTLCQTMPSKTADDLPKKLDEYMTRLTELGYSGALLVAKEGGVIFSKGYGLADRAQEISVTPETIFTTGSITKQFTAAAILKLEMMGKLHVQDLIIEYFENVPEDKRAITLHHLLTHSAGLKPALGFDFDEIGREEYIELAMKTPLNRVPGESYEYSNVGFSLLAAIVEQVSGQSYDAFLQQRLFKPAGMLNTGYPKQNWDRQKMAHGYRGQEDWGTFLDHKMAEDGPYWHLRGNGGINSTVGDMYRWHLALRGDEILSKAAKAKMYTPHIREGKSQSHYGYGWSIVDSRYGKLITHNGGNPYFEADFYRYVDRDVVIYITSNSAEQRATRISRKIISIVFGEEVSLPPLKVETLSEADLPKSEMGRHALAFLELLASKDKNTARNLIKDHYSARLLGQATVEKHLEMLQPGRDEIGAVEIGKIDVADKNSLELTVRSQKTRQWWRLELIFEPQSPHRIDGIGLVDSNPPIVSTEGGKSAGDWGLPDSPTGRRSSAFLQAVRRADHDYTKKFIEEEFAQKFKDKFSMSEHLQMFEKMYRDLAGIELEGAMKTGPYSAELTVRSKNTGRSFQVRIELAPEAPHRIAGLAVEAQEDIN